MTVQDDMQNLSTAEKAYKMKDPYADFKQPEFPEYVPVPDLQNPSADDLKKRFPQLYQKPIAKEAESMPPAFEAVAEEETILGMPVGKKAKAGDVTMEPIANIEFDILGTAFKEGDRKRVDFDLLGAKMVTDVVYEAGRDYDPKLIDPDVKLENIITFDENAKDRFMSHTRFFNSKGEAYTPTGSTFEDRLEFANVIGAVRYKNKDGKIRDFPWNRAVSASIKLRPDADLGVVDPTLGRTKTVSEYKTPSELDLAMDANNMFSYNFLNDETGKRLYSRYLNKRLIQAGVDDERTRAILINSKTSAFSMGDLENIAGNVSDNAVRPVFELGLLGFGEIADLVTTAWNTATEEYNLTVPFVDAGLIKKPISVQDLGLPVTAEQREEIFRKVYDDFPRRLMRFYISKGANITFAQAQLMASTYTGLIPKGAQLFAEIRSGTGAINMARKFTSKQEMKNFEKWSKGKYETDPKTYNEDTTFDTLLANYTAERARILRSEKKIQRRITDYYQVTDAELPKEMRVTYNETVEAIKRGEDRKRDLLANYRANGITHLNMTPTQKTRLDAINVNIDTNKFRLAGIARRSGVAKFIMDSKVQDMYMIAGATSFSHYMPEYFSQMDENMAELVGLLVGATFAATKGSVKNWTTYAAGFSGNQKAKLTYLMNNLFEGGTESFNQGLIARTEMIAKFEDELVAMGVDPDLVVQSITDITDLAALKYFEELTKESIAMNSLIDGDAAEILQSNLKQKERLLADLRSRLMNAENLSPKSEFFQLVNNGVAGFQKQADDLNEILKTIEGYEVQFFTSVARGTSDVAVKIKPDSNVAKAFSQLIKRRLFDPKAKPGDIAKMAVDLRGMIARDAEIGATKVAQKIIGDARKKDVPTLSKLETVEEKQQALLEPAQAALAARGVKPDPVTRTDPDTGEQVTTQADPMELDSPGQLLAYLALTKKAVDEEFAAEPFKVLETSSMSKTFVTLTEGTIYGTPEVDVSDIFKGLLTPDIAAGELPGLGRLTGKALTGADRSGFIGTVNELTDPYFESIAAANQTTKSEVLRSIQKQIRDAEKNLPIEERTQFTAGNKLQDLQFDVALYLTNTQNMAMMTMNPSQLLELEKALTAAKYKTKLPGVSRKFEQAQKNILGSDDTPSKFDMMTVNGVPITELEIEFRGQLVKVNDLLRMGKARWSDYKNRWWDTNQTGKEMPRLMDWANQKNVRVSSEDPYGVEFSIPPRLWIDMDKILNMKEEELVTYFRSFEETLGMRSVTGTMDRHVFKETDPEHKAYRSIIEAQLGLYVFNNYANLDPSKFMEGVRRLEKTFVMQSADGTQKPLFNFADVIDTHLDFNSLGQAITEDQVSKATVAIQQATRKALKPAKEEVRVIQETQKYLSQFAAGAVSPKSLGLSLKNLGPIGYRTMVDGVTKATGLPRNQVRGIIRQVYIRDLTIDSMEQSGRLALTEKGVAVPQNIYDSKTMRDYLGSNDPEMAEFIQSEILDFDSAKTGISHYKNAQSISGFLSGMVDDPLASKVVIKGIPRAMSVESYISRFYAINRKVVRPTYVGTEALLQKFRFGKYSFLKAIVSDAELGILFMEMVRTGRPLDPKRNARFDTLLIQFMGDQDALLGEQGEKVRSSSGLPIDVYAPQGYYANDEGIVSAFGKKRATLGFPEMRQARKEQEDLDITVFPGATLADK